ncbi:aminotransferase class IV [Streptomyces hoynatensis]|uniref:Aminotransferase n=1 Tax=Streptomyces hoynatensis TaxID=1141874 RepID=A0A3A9ZBL5_9ACTN|nr:aminotransferase class IV [Streptomyces hoynatensis]RKN45832.1 aminotransferase [Streptomyces hoynatensis]
MAQLDGAPARAEDLQALALTNYGHFTSLRVDEGRVRGLALHLERLVRDCHVAFGVALDPDRVRELAARAAHGRGGSFLLRVTVYDPALGAGDPAGEPRPRVLITTREAPPADPPPLRVECRTFVRELPAVKHVGLFGALHERRAARRNGFDDALFADQSGLIHEGATWNAGFVDAEGNVVWPKAEVLPGVTMGLLQEAHDYTVAPVTTRLDGIRGAFATNAAFGIRPIRAIGAAQLAEDLPAFATLRAAYASHPTEPLA